MPYDKWQNTPGFSAAIAGFKDAVFGAGNYVAFEARRSMRADLSAHAPPIACRVAPLMRAAHAARRALARRSPFVVGAHCRTVRKPAAAAA
jgi:hypothetical protein